MLRIKTIVHHDSKTFDEQVNTALMEGWTLIKREVIQTSPTTWKLYAELETVVITESEKCCENCLHFEKDGSDLPCNACEDASNWEAEK